MNVEASVALKNWEFFFITIYEDSRYGYGTMTVHLTDWNADLFDFANEILMGRMRERLVETLQRTPHRIPNGNLTFGNKFFITMNEKQQQSFFHVIFNLRVRRITVGEVERIPWTSPAITINTSALLETLPHLHASVRSLNVSNFALTRPSDVQALSNIILSKSETLETLTLESIKCPVDDCDKEDSDEPNGFLDPLFHAAFGLNAFSVSTQTLSVHSTLVSPAALRALLVEGREFHSLWLRGLGLTDSHVLAIVDGLSTPGTHVNIMQLLFNPGITAQGYGALLNLINRANVVGDFHSFLEEWIGFSVDDKAWEGKLNLVSEMNSEYRRLEYLTNGTFTSEERRWQWLERVANLPSPDKKKISDAKHLNFIWYTLCQNPEMMQT